MKIQYKLKNFFANMRRTNAAPTIVKEQLNDASLKRVLGEYYGQVCVYDCESQRLRDKTYNGIEVLWDSEDTQAAKVTKQIVEDEFPDFEVVALVSGQIMAVNYPWRSGWTQGKIQFNKNGECTIANMILRNKKTGRLEMYSRKWIGAWWHADAVLAACMGAHGFPSHFVLVKKFRADFLAGRER